MALHNDAKFSAIFPSANNGSPLPYTKLVVQAINKRRTALGNSLFFDMLMQDVASISNASAYYPPSSIDSLRELYQAISNASIEPVKKVSFFYYVLKDWSDEIAQAYRQTSMLPQSFSGLIDAFYALDSAQLEDALHHLCQPGLTLAYHSKIIKTFLQSTYSNGAHLAVQFVNTAGLSDENEESISLYFNALLFSSIEAAFLYQRTLDARIRSKFFGILVDHCLNSTNGIRAMKLINLPFERDEEAIFQARSAAARTDIERDTGRVRSLHRGLVKEIGEVPISQAGVELEVNWSDIRDGLAAATGPKKFVLTN